MPSSSRSSCVKKYPYRKVGYIIHWKDYAVGELMWVVVLSTWQGICVPAGMRDKLQLAS